MSQFTIDEELAAQVERLAKRKPFENLSFNAALRRVLEQHIELLEAINRTSKGNNPNDDLEELEQWLAEYKKDRKKALSPDAKQWASTIPELKGKPELSTWKALCNYFGIDPAGDSARRKLSNWVKVKHPTWPQVPETIND